MKSIDVNTFIDRCKSHFYRYARYLYDEQAKVYYVTDCLMENAALWHQLIHNPEGNPRKTPRGSEVRRNEG